MSKRYTLTAQKRERAGKGIARTLRRENQIPAVIYGDNKSPELISLNFNPVKVEYMKGHMSTNLCDLDVAGQKTLVLARDIQIHPVSDKIEHIDFLRVGPKTKIRVSVPVHVINQEQSPGIKNKGVLNLVEHEIELLCNASEIPEEIQIDLKELNIGQSIKIKDIQLPNGAKAANQSRNFTIATIVEPTEYTEVEITAPVSDAEVAAAAAAAAGGAAPAAGAKAAAPAAKADDKAKK